MGAVCNVERVVIIGIVPHVLERNVVQSNLIALIGPEPTVSVPDARYPSTTGGTRGTH